MACANRSTRSAPRSARLLAIVLMFLFNDDIRTVLWFAVIPGRLAVTVLVLRRRGTGAARGQGEGAASPRRASSELGTRLLARRRRRRHLHLGALQRSLPRHPRARRRASARLVSRGHRHHEPRLCAHAPIRRAGSRTRSARGRCCSLGLGVADRGGPRAGLWRVRLAASSSALACGGCIWASPKGVLAALIAATAPERLRGTAFGLFGLVTGVATPHRQRGRRPSVGQDRRRCDLLGRCRLRGDRVHRLPDFAGKGRRAALEVRARLALYSGNGTLTRLNRPLPQDERARQRLRRAGWPRARRFRSSRRASSAIADREAGIGCDQLIALEPQSKADVFMRIWNADGGEVGACGNAARCVAALVAAERGRAE